MRKLFGILLLQLPLVAAAADYEQSFAAGPRDYYVTGAQVDHVRFVVPEAGTTRRRIAVVGKKRIVACATRYCRSPGTQQAVVNSVLFLGPTSTVPLANGVALDLEPGIHVLEIGAMGTGTGQYRNNGPYSVTLSESVPTKRTSADD